jgi:hypothetical protein
LAASATQQVQVNADQGQLAQAIPAALQSLGWSCFQTSPTSFSSSVSMGWLSWGENITIDFSQPSWVHVTSTCAFPLQLFDWGKNNKNIGQFLDQLFSTLQQYGGPAY